MGTDLTYPPEPTHEPIRGRAATPDDCAEGRAAFAADVSSPELANVSLDVFLPQVASVNGEDGGRGDVVLIQAEVARVPENLVVLGYEDADGNLGACTSGEVEPWPSFFVFYNNPDITLNTLMDRFPKKFFQQSATLATQQFDEDDPVLFIRHHIGPHVTKYATSVAEGSEHADALAKCDSCFAVFFPDLEHALDEINTLIDTQDVLGELTQGFVYLAWNGSLEPGG